MSRHSAGSPKEPDGVGGVYRTSSRRSANMAAIKREGTAPEAAVRSALHKEGFRFRKDYPLRLNGRLVRPDVAFTRLQLAVFVDGCFWHACPVHCKLPKVNTDYWLPKLRGNTERDQVQTQLLTEHGWVVLRVWEHETVEVAVESIRVEVDKLRSRLDWKR
jgi:DNA mismatch endonuclease (patch repair protein)